MDSPAIPVMQSTSTEKTQAYKDLYSEFLGDVVLLHNYHTTYTTYTGLETSKRFRSQCMKMGKLLRKLRTASAESFEEQSQNRKIMKNNQVVYNRAKLAARRLRGSQRSANAAARREKNDKGNTK
jgi:hypothetical protein